MHKRKLTAKQIFFFFSLSNLLRQTIQYVHNKSRIMHRINLLQYHTKTNISEFYRLHDKSKPEQKVLIMKYLGLNRNREKKKKEKIQLYPPFKFYVLYPSFKK